MYVHPFWFGVFCTIVAELVACICYAVAVTYKGGKK